MIFQGKKYRRLGWLAQFLLIIAAGNPSFAQKITTPWVAQAPAGKAFTSIDKHGTTVIPNGRLLTPTGRQIEVAPHPYGLTLSPDGSVAVTANSGIRPFSISIIRDIESKRPQVQQVPPGAQTDAGILAAVFMGLAISPDNKLLYVGGGQEGKVMVFDLASGTRLDAIDCNVTIDGNASETIDGATTYALSAQYQSISIYSDGSNWHVVAKVV